MLLLATTVALVALAPRAMAHSELASSNPAANAVIKELPDRIELTFNQAIALEFAAVALGPRQGEALPLTVTVNGPTVTAAVGIDSRENQTSGTWRVAYRVTSADGHPISGTVDFKYQPKPTAPGDSEAGATDGASSSASSSTSESSAATPSTQKPSRPSGDSSWVSTMVLGGIALVATVGALILLRRRSDLE
ncbi:hypothetical protein ASE01_20260 [Nocardioides sp. Root190]|uniref:copper resistance CopC family protein n=1 Tax=Nocardioides sp. Root190 TaxID=1736488 RepID=UPI0006F8975D|nr:copper resistance CopC family protein [Nocardioides sp. Root190]KRB73109.1 hypothetical protein ASE01_20260 [Nocardioides sp. Root190]